MSEELEVRLRRALAARAGQITADRLRPAEAPGGATTGTPLARWALPALVGAAAMAVLFAVLVLRQPDGPPAQPAVPPAGPTSIAPSVEPSPPAPQPAVSPKPEQPERSSPGAGAPKPPGAGVPKPAGPGAPPPAVTPGVPQASP